ncbi:DUF4331 family protein [Caulobacter sp. 1776]|uniref:DUF4331 family protein n=1 Tax=Caulobacter sp. 1776 TaxID=3156420 RepID=UPI00339B0D69
MRLSLWTTTAFAACLVAGHAAASDHLDSPSVIADARADIGDLYAWMAPDGRRLNLVMPIVGHSFSDRLTYAFHIDSGRRFGATTASVTIVCRFPAPGQADCGLGDDVAQGAVETPDGLRSQKGRFRVFAGLRDDPFFNNVRGTRAAYDVAAVALRAGAPVDAAGCPTFDAATVAAIRHEWSHTKGGPAQNLLAGWTPASIVVQVELTAVAKGGPILGVWASTASRQRQIDRAARPLTGNALLGTIASDAEQDRMKEVYNAATPADGAQFVAEIEKGLALYDGFDGRCGDQLLATPRIEPHRYLPLAKLLADDRQWVNSASKSCAQLFAVELAALAGRPTGGDCGGRAPSYSAVNVYRSLLVDGTNTSVSDGLSHDELPVSDTVFPFLSPPRS